MFTVPTHAKLHNYSVSDSQFLTRYQGYSLTFFCMT